jgi:hypothetical protein
VTLGIASSRPNVAAAHHLTSDDDGLAHGWQGTVYMNPPYGREIGAWCDKLATEYAYGNVSAAVGTAGQYGVVTSVGGSIAPKVVVKSWSLWGTHVGSSSNGAGTLIVPGTNPG